MSMFAATNMPKVSMSYKKMTDGDFSTRTILQKLDRAVNGMYFFAGT